MLTCKQLVEKASEYVDGDLTRWQRFKLSAHIFMCVHCKRYILQLKQTITMVSKLPDKELDKDIEHDLCKKYEQLMQDRQQEKPR